MGVPKAAKHFANLVVPDSSAQRSKAKTSYFSILETLSKKPKKNKTIKYIKIAPDAKTPVPMFEAACADYFRLIDLNIAPTTRVYYDDNECDLLFVPSWREEDVQKLAQGFLDPLSELKSTYLFTEKKLYYLSKREKKIITFPLPPETLEKLKTDLSLPTAPPPTPYKKCLTPKELALTEKATGHAHDATCSIVGVGSKKLAGFQPNLTKPLKSKHLIIGELELVSTAEERRQFLNKLAAYSEYLTPEENPEQGYLSRIYTYAAETYNKNLDQTTSQYTKAILDEFISGKHKLSKESINAILIAQFKVRLTHISGLLEKQAEITAKNEPYKKYQDQLKRLQSAPPDASQQLYLQELQASKPSITAPLPDFLPPAKKTKYEEEMATLQQLIQSTVQIRNKAPAVTAHTIEHFEKLDHIYGSALDDIADENRVLSYETPGQILNITVKDLKNYRIVKGLATGLVASYVFKEGDCHNRNLAKNGKRIDFDMTLWDISCNWKSCNIVERFKRFPTANTFVVTADDIIKFPNLRSANFFYWPSKQTDITESAMDTVNKDLKYSISENFYRTSDNAVYQKLALHPMFIFHKYKTFLKFILTTPEMYTQITNLHMFPEHDVRIMQTLPADLALKNTCVITPNGLFQFNEQGDIRLILDGDELKQQANRLGLQQALKDAAQLTPGESRSIKNELPPEQFIQLSKQVTDKGGVSLRGTTYVEKGSQKEKSLPNEMVANLTARIAEVKNVLIGMPEFQKFLIEYGSSALNMILEEFQDYRTKYQNKSEEKKGIFKDVVDTIRLDDIKNAYWEIFKAANPSILLSEDAFSAMKDNPSIRMV